MSSIYLYFIKSNTGCLLVALSILQMGLLHHPKESVAEFGIGRGVDQVGVALERGLSCVYVAAICIAFRPPGCGSLTTEVLGRGLLVRRSVQQLISSVGQGAAVTSLAPVWSCITVAIFAAWSR